MEASICTYSGSRVALAAAFCENITDKEGVMNVQVSTSSYMSLERPESLGFPLLCFDILYLCPNTRSNADVAGKLSIEGV